MCSFNFSKKLTIRELLIHLGYSQLQPFRIIFFIYLPSLFVSELHMPVQSAVLIFNFLPFFVLANVGYIAFIEKNKLKQKGKQWFFYWLMVISIGIFTVEFIGLFTHTMISFYEGHPTEDAEKWNYIATIFTGLGGIILEINYFFGERIDKWILSRVNQKYAILGAAGFTIVVALISLVINPQVQAFFKLLL